MMNLCDAISDNMIAYREMYNALESSFEGCELKHITRGSNEEADALATIGSMCSPIPDGVFYEVINKRSIKHKPPAKPTVDSGASSSTATDPDVLLNQAEASDPTVAQGPAAQVFLVNTLWT